MTDGSRMASPVRGAATPWRLLFWVGFYAAVVRAWVALFLMVRAAGLPAPLPGGAAAEFWASLCLAASEADPLALFAMWTVMSAAMMLPTFVPALRTYGDLQAVQASDATGMAALVAGYGAVWLGFSALAAAAQLALSRAGALAPDGTLLLPWLNVALLAAAGVYQFSAMKAACLSKCRHPLMFFMEHWKPGPAAALRMGARLGAFCLGCCWMLMLLGFVGGAMNLLWMGAATLFMICEKLPGLGRWLTQPAGLALLAGAALVAADTLNWI